MRGVGGDVVAADIGEDEIAVLAGEVAAALRRAGVHDRRIRRLDRLRLQIAALDAVELAVEVESLVRGPQPLDDGEPFLGAGVAVVVLEERDAEHFHFRIIPAVDDVERVTAIGNVIDDGRLLGGDDRMIERDMRGRDHAGIFGGAGDAGGPGEGLEARPLRIGGAAKAAPARHRHQRLEVHLVGELRQRHGVRPGQFQPAVEIRHHAAGIEIGLERAELELAAAERRIGVAPVFLMWLDSHAGAFSAGLEKFANVRKIARRLANSSF